MDPVLQIFQQSREGSAEGQGFGSSYAQGRQFNLQQQHLNLQKRQDEREQREQDALLPLKKSFAQLQNEQLGIQLVNTHAEANNKVQVESALPKLNNLLFRFHNSPEGFNDPDLLQEAAALSQQYPAAFVGSAPGARILQNIEGATAFKGRFVRLLDANKQLKDQGLILKDYNEKSGEMSIGLRDDELKKQRVQNEIKRLENEAIRLGQSGDRNAQAQVRLRINALKEGVEAVGLPDVPFSNQQPVSTPDVQTTPQSDALAPSVNAPTQTAPIQPAPQPITLRQVERPLTPAAVTKLQEANSGYNQALSALQKLEKVIQDVPEAFGAKGIGSELYESATGQLHPERAAKISKAREEAGLAFVQVAPMLRADTGPMNRYEEGLIANIGDTRNWKDYPERAAQKTDSIKKMIIAKKLNALMQLNKKPDDALLRMISPSELIPLNRSGALDKATISRWYDLKKESEAK